MRARAAALVTMSMCAPEHAARPLPHLRQQRSVFSVLLGVLLAGVMLTTEGAAENDAQPAAQEERVRPQFDMSELRKGAEEGSAAAQYNLALLLLGEGDALVVPGVDGELNGVDEEGRRAEAEKLYAAAAAQGHHGAMRNLGVLLMDPDRRGRTRADAQRAAELWEEAADDGEDTRAQYNLGRLLLFGQGDAVPRDLSRAKDYLQAAADQEDVDALFLLGFLYDKGSPQDRLFVDRRRAAQYYEQAADLGSADAANNLAVLLFEGFGGVQEDKPRAIELWREAAEKHDHIDAKVALAALYEVGDGVPRDFTRATSLYEQAAEQGHPKALAIFGTMLVRGQRHVAADPARALKMLKAAAGAQNPDAIFNLGVLFEEGIGVEKSLPRARRYYQRAARLGHENAYRKVTENTQHVSATEIDEL